MKLTDLLSKDLVDINLKGSSKEELIDELIDQLDEGSVLKSKRKFKKAIWKREKEGTTGIGFSIAIPHGKSKAVLEPSVAFGIKSEGADWNSSDGEPAKLIFMIAVPEESAGNEHLKILQMLSRKLMDETYRERLLKVQSAEEAITILEEIE
jgi:fructose-specific phosphotransferase system IIA component